MNRKDHWESVYNTKKFTEVSWFQKIPESSLNLIRNLNLSFNSGIIDIGGGDSFLVDYLLDDGFKNITVLDISNLAIERAKKRLGEKAINVKWVITDVSDFKPMEKYDLWHDRAAFHFLTGKTEIDHYLEISEESVKPGGYLIMAAFSDKGPEKCSGLPVNQYSTDELKSKFSNSFENLHCENVSHQTPSGNIQDFSFCSFRRKN